MEINIDNIIAFLLSAQVQEQISGIRVAVFIFSGVLLAILIFTILKTHYFQWLFMRDIFEFSTFRQFGAKRITRMWNKILKRLESGSEQEYKLAIIEADSMLDVSLKRMGYAGQALDERLNLITRNTLPNVEEVKEAHKVRNLIAHDPSYRLTVEEAKMHIKAFEQAFNVLDILT
ncbi:MAG: hypothetical protein ABH805_00745 [Candidatus Nealsonbacteria bacterium]